MLMAAHGNSMLPSEHSTLTGIKYHRPVVASCRRIGVPPAVISVRSAGASAIPSYVSACRGAGTLPAASMPG